MNTNNQETLMQAISAIKAGNTHFAEQLLQDLVDKGHSNPDILAILGTVKMEMQQFNEALTLFDRVLEEQPENLSTLYNKGRALQILGKLKEAEEVYEAITQKAPSFPHAWNNLGLIYRETGRFEQARQALEKAVALAPNEPYFLNNLGVILEGMGRLDEALKLFQQAVALQKDYFSARFNLGCLLFRLGNTQEAERHLLWVLSVKEDEPTAKFLLQSLGHFQTPERAPTHYVKKTFDDCAAQFEEKLVKELDYKTPEYLFDSIKKWLRSESNILDLGCGTGLGAQYYRPYARFLAGMDCSEKMLEKAREKAIYDALYQHDIAQPWPTKERFDVIYSADCLCYFGNLQTVFQRVWEALAPQGIFGFSVEKAPEDEGTAQEGYRLGTSGRYAHRYDYVTGSLSDTGLVPLAHREVVLRKEGGQDVKGFIFIAQKDRS
ncbi:MAG: tetratricopeptide repeat protein [Thermodesulfobacteria bacterium]|nr:tetratricopeptide repeat protein [Thermodesulfobacteriota bacterium]